MKIEGSLPHPLGSQSLPGEIAAPPAKQPTQLPPLAVGQEVTAEVVDELANGALLIEVLGTVLEAETSNPFPVGAHFTARIEQLRPQLVLQVLPGVDQQGQLNTTSRLQQEAAQILRATISHHTSSGESLQALEHGLAVLVEHPPPGEIPPHIAKLQTFMKTLFPHETPPTAEQLAAFVRDGGLHYEAKLLQALTSGPQALTQTAEADLKGLLLQVLRETKADQFSQEVVKARLAQETTLQTPTRELATTITHHLEHIESQQAVNLLAQAKGEPYQLQIPFFTGQGMTTAFLSIEADSNNAGEKAKGRKGKKGEDYNILFLLDLDGFGQTRIAARIGKRSLWVAFYVDQQDSVALLKEELPAFRETLQSLGYDEVLLVAKPLGQLSPEKRKKFEALTIGVSPSVHLLDVKA